jgi:heat shock protein HslJ
MQYPRSVSVKLGGEKFAGCGGDPASLLQGKWTVRKIDGRPAVKEPKISLNFGTESQLTGSASCNRYFGSYALSAENLTISELGSSMMMCDGPIMDQETQFLGILREVRGFEIGQDRSLVLHAKDGRAIAASRRCCKGQTIAMMK